MHRRDGLFALGFAAALALTALPVHADGMRCGTKLVREGQRTTEVRATCGPPTTAQRRIERISSTVVDKDGKVIVQTADITVDEWTYDFGPHEFVQHLRFENGILVRVTSGAHGKPR